MARPARNGHRGGGAGNVEYDRVVGRVVTDGGADGVGHRGGNRCVDRDAGRRGGRGADGVGGRIGEAVGASVGAVGGIGDRGPAHGHRTVARSTRDRHAGDLTGHVEDHGVVRRGVGHRRADCVRRWGREGRADCDAGRRRARCARGVGGLVGDAVGPGISRGRCVDDRRAADAVGAVAWPAGHHHRGRRATDIQRDGVVG